jgi:hypothetical protein
MEHNIYCNEIPPKVIAAYCASCVDWFQEETMLIATIDKLVQINYQYYEPIIRKLHNILMISLKLFIEDQSSWKYSIDFGVPYGKEYILYLLDNNDLTKLKPTQQQFGFMYLCYYSDFYSIGLVDDNNQTICLYQIIENNLFNDEIFSILFKNISNNIQKHLTVLEKQYFVSSIHKGEEPTNKRRKLA